MTQVAQLKQMMRLYYGQNLRELNHSSSAFAPRQMSAGDEIDAGLTANLNRYLQEKGFDQLDISASTLLSPQGDDDERCRDSILRDLSNRISADLHLDQLRRLDPDAAFACAALVEELSLSQQTALIRSIAEQVRNTRPPTTEERTSRLQQEAEYLETALPNIEGQNAAYHQLRKAYDASPEGKAAPQRPDVVALLQAERPSSDTQGLSQLQGMDDAVKRLAGALQATSTEPRPQTVFMPKSRSAVGMA